MVAFRLSLISSGPKALGHSSKMNCPEGAPSFKKGVNEAAHHIVAAGTGAANPAQLVLQEP